MRLGESTLRAGILGACMIVSCRHEPRSSDPVPTSAATVAAPSTLSTSTETTGGFETEQVTFPSGALALHGIVYRPRGAGPFPAIVFNHGSEKDPGPGLALARFYTSHGFLLMLPRRRGHDGSPGEYWKDAADRAPPSERAQKTVDLLVEQNDDVVAAFTYLKQRKDVDKKRLIVSGCSFGGIETLLTAERDLELRAALDFAGGAMSWKGSAALRARLEQAANHAKVPVLFVQAENDFDTAPTKTLSAAMDKTGLVHESKIFPAFGTSHEDGHGKFCSTATDVWGPTVLAFLKQHAG